MIKIKVNNEFLDTKEDLTIPVEFYSNNLEIEQIYASKSFNFSIPKTPKNYNIIFFESFLELNVDIYINNSVFSKAQLNIKKINEFTIDVSLDFVLVSFFNKIATKSLLFLDSKYNKYLETSSLNYWIDKYYPEVDFYCPTIAFDSNFKILNYYSNGYVRDHNNYKYIKGFFALGFIIEKIFNYAGYTVLDSIFKTDPFLSKLMLIYVNSTTPVDYYMKFSNSVPDILMSDFIKDCIKIFNLRINFDTNTVVIGSGNTYSFNETPVFLSDINIYKIEPSFNKVTYETIYDGTTSSLIYNFTTGTKELSINFEYQVHRYSYTVPILNYNVMNIGGNIAPKKKIFAVYEYKNYMPNSYLSYNDISIDGNASHFFYSYLLKTLLLKNKLLKKIDAKIQFDQKYLSKIQKINVVNYDNRQYLVEKISGNLTGNKIEIMNLTAYILE